MMALETADIPNDEERFRSSVPVFGRPTNVRRTITIVGQCSGRKIICLHQPTHTQRPTTLYVPLQRCGVCDCSCSSPLRRQMLFFVVFCTGLWPGRRLTS